MKFDNYPVSRYAKQMLLTPHVLVGVTVASLVRNPFIAVPVSFGLHFLGDMVPHWDFYTGTTREERIKGWRPLAVMGDMAIGVAVGVFFTLYGLWVKNDALLATNMFLCGVTSVLPDVLTGPSLYIENSHNLFRVVHKIQSKLQFSAGLPWGMLTQLLISFVAVGVSISALR